MPDTTVSSSAIHDADALTGLMLYLRPEVLTPEAQARALSAAQALVDALQAPSPTFDSIMAASMAWDEADSKLEYAEAWQPSPWDDERTVTVGELRRVIEEG